MDILKVNKSVKDFDKFIFYIETNKGYCFNVLFHLIKNYYNYIRFKINKKGFFLCMLDGQNSSIIDFSLYGKFMNNFIFNPLR